MLWFILLIATAGLLYAWQYERQRRHVRRRRTVVADGPQWNDPTQASSKAEPAMPNPPLQVNMTDTAASVEAQQGAEKLFRVLQRLTGQFPWEVADDPRVVEASWNIPEMLDKVPNKNRPALFRRIVSYSGASVNVLLRLVEFFPDEVLADPSFQVAASNPDTPIDSLLKIARYLPHKVAENPTFIKRSRRSPNFLTNMPESDRHLLLQHAAGNQNTSIELLVKLLGAFPQEVQGNLVFRNLLAEVPALRQKMLALDLTQISYLDDIPEIFIEAIAKSQSRLLHKALLDVRSKGGDWSNSKGGYWSTLSQEAVIAIMPDINVRRHLASSLDASIEILLKLATEFPQEVVDNPIFMLLFLEDSSISQRMPYHDLAQASSHKNAPSIFLAAARQDANDNDDDEIAYPP